MSTSNLKWQAELSDSTAKVTELTKKCKNLTEELMNTRKESVELSIEKNANTQKAQDVKVEKQKIEMEIKSCWPCQELFCIVNFGQPLPFHLI